MRRGIDSARYFMLKIIDACGPLVKLSGFIDATDAG
jgi:hypothetical protein